MHANILVELKFGKCYLLSLLSVIGKILAKVFPLFWHWLHKNRLDYKFHEARDHVSHIHNYILCS